jgi:integrase
MAAPARAPARAPAHTPRLFHLDPSQRFAKGGWLVRWRDPDGQHRRTFKTKQEALDHLKALDNAKAKTHADRLRGVPDYPQKGKTPLRDVAEQWYTGRRASVRAKTLAGYRGILNKHVLPEFGDRGIGTITSSDIVAYLGSRTTKSGKPISASTRRNILHVLSPVMEAAFNDDFINKNPCKTKAVQDAARSGTTRRTEMLHLTQDEVAALADAIDPYYRTFVLTAAYTGMRQGELHALRVKRVDLEKKTLTVAESAVVVGGEVQFVPPKTSAGEREIWLPPFLVELLREQIAGKGPDDFVFSRPNGDPLRQGDYYLQHFKRAVKTALPKKKHGLRFHDLRHTHASILIAQDVNFKVISQRLGHSSIAITIDRYGHVNDEEQMKLVAGLESAHAKLRQAK